DEILPTKELSAPLSVSSWIAKDLIYQLIPNGGGDHEVVSLASGSSGTRSLHAAANHNDNDEHHNNHHASAAAPSGADCCFRTSEPRQLWDTGYAWGMSADATAPAAILPT